MIFQWRTNQIMELTDDEMDYYNALYALIGIQRKYGKDNAISFLTLIQPVPLSADYHTSYFGEHYFLLNHLQKTGL